VADATLALMRNRVLEKLFVLIAGETAEAEDAEIVERVIVSVNEDLRENEICYWADSGTPQHLVEHLAALYACYLANDYMDAQEAMAFRADNEAKAMFKIRELTANVKRVATPSRATYF
jgi:hypothetical protein